MEDGGGMMLAILSLPFPISYLTFTFSSSSAVSCRGLLLEQVESGIWKGASSSICYKFHVYLLLETGWIILYTPRQKKSTRRNFPFSSQHRHDHHPTAAAVFLSPKRHTHTLSLSLVLSLIEKWLRWIGAEWNSVRKKKDKEDRKDEIRFLLFLHYHPNILSSLFLLPSVLFLLTLWKSDRVERKGFPSPAWLIQNWVISFQDQFQSPSQLLTVFLNKKFTTTYYYYFISHFEYSL